MTTIFPPVSVDPSSTLEHIPLFTGTLYYVDDNMADDTGVGTAPDTAKKTIGAAKTLATAGDAITIKAGTYTETGLDIDKQALELWPEIGTILDPASGTGLVVSANYCRIKGEHKITPATGEIGLFITGTECIVEKSKILNGAIGIKTTGQGVVLNDCAVGLQTSVSYDLQGIQGRLYRCKTVGNATTTGYRISNGVGTGVLEQCTSTGHALRGFYIGTGSDNWTVLNCSSGGGDGKWVDVDNANIWSNFSFDNNLFKSLTLDADSATKQYNLYKVTGIVQIDLLYAHVESTLSTNHTNCHIDVYDGSAVVLSDATGLTLSDAPVGSLIIRNADVGNMLGYSSGANAFLSENASYRDPQKPFIVGQKGDGTTTYIRFVHTTTDSVSSGTLHWHAHWKPVTGDGFLEAV